MAAESPETVTLAAPKGVAGCSVHGVEYKAGKAGAVTVPAAAAPELERHGFTRVAPDAA